MLWIRVLILMQPFNSITPYLFREKKLDTLSENLLGLKSHQTDVIQRLNVTLE